MGLLMHKTIFVGGMLLLLHSAYSAAQYRTLLRVTEQEYTSLPIDITIQGLVSLIITMFGVIYNAGEFKEIRAAIQMEEKSWETLGNRPSFYSFCHRGKILGSESALKSTSYYGDVKVLS